MIVLMPVECKSCGVTFAVPRAFYDERVADRRTFTCPSACKVQLGAESSTDRMVQSLSRQVVEMGEALTEARLMIDEQLRENAGLEEEIGILRNAIVQYELGPATAPEGS